MPFASPAVRVAAMIVPLPLLLLFPVGCGDAAEVDLDPPGLDGAVPGDVRMDGGAPDGCEPFTVFRDADEDGHGDPDTSRVSCGEIPQGWVSIGNDCNDACFECSPLSPELCDGLDNDCDGRIDDELDGESATFFADTDGDGFGDPRTAVSTCGAPQGFVAEGGDCRDEDPRVNPDAAESCNAADDDCDALVDEDLTRPLADAQLLGDANGTFLDIALDAWQGGYVAVWTADDRRVVYLTIPDGASPDPSRARPIAPVQDTLTGQAMPAVSIVQSGGAPWAVVAWVEGDVILARAVRLTDDARSRVTTVSNTTDLSRVPLVIETTRDEVVILWMVNGDRQQVRARLFNPSTETMADEATIFVSGRVSPDNFGPTGLVLASDPDTLYLGVTDRRFGDEVPVGYVHRVTLRPELTAASDLGARLVPTGGRAADRVLLAPVGGSRPDQARLMAFLSSGTRPERFTDAFSVRPNPSGSVQVERVGTVDGLALGGTGARGGSDVVVAREEAMGATTLALLRQGRTGEVAALGTLGTLLPDPWALLARQDELNAAALWAGRISESAVAPAVWLQRYGCTDVVD